MPRQIDDTPGQSQPEEEAAKTPKPRGEGREGQDEQLLAPWEMAHEFAFLVVISGRRTGSFFRLDGPRSVIGRSRKVLVFVDDPLAEGEHASIRCEKAKGQERGEFVLRDLDSAGGTYLNGRRLASSAVLSDGDLIRVGETELVFKRI